MYSKIGNFKLLPIAIGINFKLLFCVLLSSCAIRQQPSGGEKDIVSPKIERSIPENYSVNFTAKQIRIDFDEYIDLKELNKQLVISPLMNSDPEVSVKSKSLIIKLPDSLRENTTYTMNFGNAIVDTHEANAFDDFQYVFSTGPVLDSLQVNGEIKFAENLKTEKGIVAMLYNNISDTVVYNTLPDYFAKTDSAGNFLIKNLRPGTYKLFALKDANANYKFDSKAEAIAFSNETITVPDSTIHHLKLFIEPDTLPHVLKAQFVAPGKAIIVFTAPVKDFQVKPLTPGDNNLKDFLFEKSGTTDTIYVYRTDSLIDSLNAVIFDGEVIVDTIHVNLNSMITSRGKGDFISPSLNVKTNLSGDVLEMPAHLIISFSTPLKSFDISGVALTKDSSTTIPLILNRLTH